jgi:hypothetical protein
LRNSDSLLVFLVAGGIIGLVGVALFGVAHAVAIVPIWSRLPGGVPFGLAAGFAMGWAFFELLRSGGLNRRLLSGLAFGALLWVTLIPMTTAAVLLREAGFHTIEDTWEVVLELLLVVATGGAAGWMMTRKRRPALALAVASLGIALAQAGPVPVTNSLRAARLFAGLSVLYPVCGVALAVLVSAMTRRRIGGGPTSG